MDIEQIKKLKRNLEADIGYLLSDFARETGVTPTGCDIGLVEVKSNSGRGIHISGVSVELEII